MPPHLRPEASVHDREPPLHTDRPTLLLGMIGFSREQERAVDHLLRRPASGTGTVRWRLGDLREADAWWANGARTRLLADGSLRIAPGDPRGRSMRLGLHEVDRPIAFAEPLACPEIEPACSFRLDDPASMEAVLVLMQTRWLAPTVARLWLAGRLVANGHALTHRIYHLELAGRLLAVVDRLGSVGIAPGAKIQDLERAAWLPRPASGHGVPPAFHQATLSELAWSYALRARGELLPARYRTARIHFRHPPEVPRRLLREEHLLAMRELAARPSAFGELQARTRLGAAQLARTLSALHLAGSITTEVRA